MDVNHLKKFLFGIMKSLKESLFDNNIKKDVTIREAYCLLAGKDGIWAGGMPIGQMFMANKLLKYPNPYYRDQVSDGLAGLLGVIVDLPVPSEIDYNKGSKSKWSENAKNVLNKYIQRSWKPEFDKGFEVNIRKSVLGKDMIEILLEFRPCVSKALDGFYQFTFKLK